MTTKISRKDIPNGPPTRRFFGRFFAVTVHAGDVTGFTCSVSKRTFPTAVERNRQKRRCRSAFQAAFARHSPPGPLVVTIKKSSENAEFAELIEEAVTACHVLSKKT